LTGKLPERLPSMAVKSRLLVEAKAVAQQQIVEAMLEDSDPSILISYIQMPHPFFLKTLSIFPYNFNLPKGKSMSN